MIKKMIVLLGKPGSGKGVFSNFILKHQKSFIHLATGNLARSQSQKNTLLGKEIKKIINRGELLSANLISKLLFQELSQTSQDVILDGYPRTIEQYQILQEFLKKFPFKIYYWILKIDDLQILTRISNRLQCYECQIIYNLISKKPLIFNQCDRCHRKLKRRDDDLFQGKKRLEIFKKQTQSLLNFLIDDQNLKINVFDASKNLLQIESQIKTILKKIFS